MAILGPNDYITITDLAPLGSHLKNASDGELIRDISTFEARKQYCKWSINEATVAYYEATLHEWSTRYGKKHVPRLAFAREKIVSQFCEYPEWKD
tara:strand:+ start:10411 stop:10695 length:285 start_codon:yes stop_codon:yes gene_type:complete